MHLLTSYLEAVKDSLLPALVVGGQVLVSFPDPHSK